jgi:hypothetical protein
MTQTSLADYVEALDKAGPLTRYTDEKRVDQLPMLMEQNPNTAEKTTSSLPDNQLKDDGSQAEGNGLARMSFR